MQKFKNTRFSGLIIIGILLVVSIINSQVGDVGDNMFNITYEYKCVESEDGSTVSYYRKVYRELGSTDIAHVDIFDLNGIPIINLPNGTITEGICKDDKTKGCDCCGMPNDGNCDCGFSCLTEIEINNELQQWTFRQDSCDSLVVDLSGFIDSLYITIRDSLLIDQTFTDSIFTIIRDSLIIDQTFIDSLIVILTDSLDIGCITDAEFIPTENVNEFDFEIIQEGCDTFKTRLPFINGDDFCEDDVQPGQVPMYFTVEGESFWCFGDYCLDDFSYNETSGFLTLKLNNCDADSVYIAPTGGGGSESDTFVNNMVMDVSCDNLLVDMIGVDDFSVDLSCLKDNTDEQCPELTGTTVAGGYQITLAMEGCTDPDDVITVPVKREVTDIDCIGGVQVIKYDTGSDVTTTIPCETNSFAISAPCTAFVYTESPSGVWTMTTNYPECSGASTGCPCYEACASDPTRKILRVK